MKGCIDIQVHLMNNYNDFSKLYRILVSELADSA